MKKALITGINGQDGSYLAEILLDKGYEVHGVIRRASTFNTKRIDHLYKDPHNRDARMFLHYGDMTDSSNLNRLLEKTKPHEIYNLAAQSHVQVSFEMPEYTSEVNGIGTLRFLDAIKESDLETPFYPRSPYGVSKLFSYWTTKNYREAYNLFACNGILFNHESPRRGETFVTRKITRAAVRIKYGIQDKLYLGNLSAKRDWGYAPEYCEGMWMILQQEEPCDLLFATNETHTVREFAKLTFEEAGMDLIWEGVDDYEKGYDRATGRLLVEVDPRYYRPTEVDILRGDYSKAKRIIGWEPKVKFRELVKIMVESDHHEITDKGRV